MSTITHVVGTKVIQSLGDLNLLLGIKKGVGELLALTQGALNNLEARDIAEEVGDADVVAVGVAGCWVGVLASLNANETGVIAWIGGQLGVLTARIWHCSIPLESELPFTPFACAVGSGSQPGHIVDGWSGDDRGAE